MRDARVHWRTRADGRRMNGQGEAMRDTATDDGYITADGRKIGGVAMELRNITLRFGGVVAIKDISFDIRWGEIRAIIGPNGAGKSSMLNVISGFYHPQEGEVIFKGYKRPKMRPYQVARMGIARTFQNIALFEGMSVLDNIMTGPLAPYEGQSVQQAMWWGKASARKRKTARRSRRSSTFWKSSISAKPLWRACLMG
jgi:branched-chain amino acid transport system ATP-binding protein